MATWKKVIVSGSNAALNQLNVGSNQQITTNPSTTYLSGSFSGSFFGDGTGITGIAASFPVTAKTDLASTDQFFINDGVSKYVTYSDLLVDLAGTNLATASGDSLTLATDITGLNSVSATSFTGSLEGTASYATAVQSIQSNITNNTNNYLLTATGGGDINGEANLTFNGSVLSVTGDVTVSGDLTVNGTTTTINTNNLLVEDKFVLLASGSTANADGGIIIQNNVDGSGFGYFLDAVTAPRWGFTSSLAGNATTATADEYVVSARLDAGTWSAGGTAPTYGGSAAGYGNIVVDNNSDIWIYA
jgi:hypothetical protein